MTFETKLVLDASNSARVRRVGSRLLGAVRHLDSQAQTALDLGDEETARLLRGDAHTLDARYAAYLRRIAAET